MSHLFCITWVVGRDPDRADNRPGTRVAVVHQHAVEGRLLDVHFMYDFLLDVGENGVAPPRVTWENFLVVAKPVKCNWSQKTLSS